MSKRFALLARALVALVGVTLAGDALAQQLLSAARPTTSTQLRSVITDPTGTGALVFSTSPTLTTPVIGATTFTGVGAYAATFTFTGATGVTFPTSGTLATKTGTLTAGNVANLTAGGVEDSGVQLVTSLPAYTAFFNNTSSIAAPAQVSLYGKLPSILKNTNTIATLANTSGETVVTSYTVTGGAMDANACLRITSRWSWTNSANNKTIIIRVGGTGTNGTALLSSSVTTTTNGLDVRMVCNNNSVSAQRSPGNTFATAFPVAASGSGPTSISVNTASNFTIYFNINMASGAETTNVDGLLIELIPGV